MTSEYDADSFNRTALLLAHELGDSAEGAGCQRRSRVLIVAGFDVCTTRNGQAALVTAVKTAVRAFGTVDVALAVSAAEILGGPEKGLSLAVAVTGEGACLVDVSTAVSEDSVIVLGKCPDVLEPRTSWLAAYWTGWTAVVAPTRNLTCEQVSVDGNVLSAIVAGALVVAEKFFTLLPSSDASVGRRLVEVDLWAPGGNSETSPPDLAYCPAQWWLLGLGHLGQGFAHAISWLDLAEPSEAQVVLQDTQVTVRANHSTGLLTPVGSEGERKTRIAAAALDKCGYQTVIVERRMTRFTPTQAEDMHVALVGVDNLATRREIDYYNWRTTIDVGIGSGARDFAGLTILRFPGRPSAQIPAWQDEPDLLRQRPQLHAPGLDACGLTELNGVAVGASFVGAIAGALAVAEACRPLHGGVAHTVQCRELLADEAEAVTIAVDGLPVALPLKRS